MDRFFYTKNYHLKTSIKKTRILLNDKIEEGLSSFIGKTKEVTGNLVEQAKDVSSGLVDNIKSIIPTGSDEESPGYNAPNTNSNTNSTPIPNTNTNVNKEITALENPTEDINAAGGEDEPELDIDDCFIIQGDKLLVKAPYYKYGYNIYSSSIAYVSKLQKRIYKPLSFREWCNLAISIKNNSNTSSNISSSIIKFFSQLAL